MKLLVIDDIQTNIMMLRAVFKSSDYEFFEANNANDGYEILKEEKIQIAIIDWMMPGLDGLSLIKKIRSEISEYYVYIIMVTARDGSDAMIEALESGVDDYVKRPFSTREIRARVKIAERIIQTENELKKTRIEIEAAKHEWEATADAIAQLVALLDRDGRIIRINRTAEDWGLVWIDEAVGETFHKIIKNVYKNFGEKIEDIWETVTEKIDSGREYELIMADDKLGHHFHVQFEPIEHGEESKIRRESYVAVSIQDITLRRNLEIALQIEHDKSEELLLNILPEPISHRLKHGEKIIVDEFENATVLFTDLVGFTQFASHISPSTLISILNDIFSQFDHLTEKHGLEKIKTIGDSYMAVSGVPTVKANHAITTVDLAIDMLEAIEDFNQHNNYDFNIRIGIHSGSLIAGVIGQRKFAYDLWGDTVNTASRMESTGIPGAIQISEQTAALLPETYLITARDPIVIKGKGIMQTYLVGNHK